MNSPVPSTTIVGLNRVNLDDKFTLKEGTTFMSGVQALVRLPMVQRMRDLQSGHNTAGLISGYRGSPLGGYDQALWKSKKHLEANHIVFQPGVNEELAATALWGSQQLGFAPRQPQKYDGVFGIWYGKGPGVDRCVDVFKHANMAGTTSLGGVIAVAGDDHIAKSSSVAHQSDHVFKSCGLPVFFPSSVQEILDFGLHAFAMSRFAGVWTGMKTIQEIVESSACVDLDLNRVQLVLPEFEMPEGGLHIRWPDSALEQEERLFHFKWYAALAYVRANRLNYTLIEGTSDRIGLIASGKAYNDTRQALINLGLNDAECRRLGIRLHKVGVVWPLDAQITREFAKGLKEILVIEEKRQIIEYQLKEELYNWQPDVRPDVLGKFDEQEGDHTGGEWSVPNPAHHVLLRANNDLNPDLIGRAIALRLLKIGVDGGTRSRLERELLRMDADAQKRRLAEVQSQRPPWFCSGCPHNTSTVVPMGSRATAGIGCHYMAIWMDRNTFGFTQMGGEGVTWVGQQPFTKETHIFANLGDGTYFHSGILAIRQSIVAGVNITYKILYNDAVAMTGGQPLGERPEGHSVCQMVQSLKAEGVSALVIVAEDPSKYDESGWAQQVRIAHRDQLDAIQLELREAPGTSIIIYDQTCATEKRRRRKRGLAEEAASRAYINPWVCEGCGDCGVQSNCISIEPVQTAWGRKRVINQSNCNQDLSCVKGHCPSLITISGSTLKKAQTIERPDSRNVPEPEVFQMDQPWSILVAGIGGTGVITIGQILGMASHIEGKGVVTQEAAGLAQKGGATWSHVVMASTQAEIHTTRVGHGRADLVLGCDLIVAAGLETLSFVDPSRSRMVLNEHETSTAHFIHDPLWQHPGCDAVAQMKKLLGDEAIGAFDAHELAERSLGDGIYVNMIVLGYAWQKGWIPLHRSALMRAIELNGTAVEENQLAFELGRERAWLDRNASHRAQAQLVHWYKKPNLSDLVQEKTDFLVNYQNRTYAKKYQDFVLQVQAAEQRAVPGSDRLARAVTENLAHLMAYKDEYEVARLHTLESFEQMLKSEFSGPMEIRYHFAPKWLNFWLKNKPFNKFSVGWPARPLMKCLAWFKFLRGTPWDPFGYDMERRREREWITRYMTDFEKLLPGLNPSRLDAMVVLARVPEKIKGFGHIKAECQSKALNEWLAIREELG